MSNRRTTKINPLAEQEQQAIKPAALDSHVQHLQRTGRSECKRHGAHSNWRVVKRKNQLYKTAYCIDCRKELNRTNYLQNKEAYKSRSVKSITQRKLADPILYKFKRQKHHANRWNVTWTVSLEYLRTLWTTQNQKCALTGLPLTPFNLSLDRIDSNRGYEPGNVQWVLDSINKMKLDHTVKQFIELCELVITHSKEKN
jgi:hypothetical protein